MSRIDRVRSHPDHRDGRDSAGEFAQPSGCDPGSRNPADGAPRPQRCRPARDLAESRRASLGAPPPGSSGRPPALQRRRRGPVLLRSALRRFRRRSKLWLGRRSPTTHLAIRNAPNVHFFGMPRKPRAIGVSDPRGAHGRDRPPGAPAAQPTPRRPQNCRILQASSNLIADDGADCGFHFLESRDSRIVRARGNQQAP